MKENVSLKELFAFVVRRGKGLIITALVFGVVMSAFMAIRQATENTNEQLEEYWQAMEDYEESKRRLAEEVTLYEHRLEMQQIYNENSLYMQIDSNNTCQATVSFAITDVDDALLSQFTSMDYLVSRISNQYVSYWEGLVLMDAMQGNPYADSEEKYIRELMTMESSGGGVLNLTIVAAEEDDAAALADSAWQCLQDAKSLVTKASFEHELVLLSKTTKLVVDKTMASRQQGNTSNADYYRDRASTAKRDLKNLAEPEFPSVFQSAVVGAVLGVLAGVFLAALWSVAVYFFRSRVETSRELEQNAKLDFLGSVAPKQGFFGCLADDINQERTWKEPQQAMQFILESLRIRCGQPGTVALVTSLPEEKKNASVQTVAEALTAEGWRVSCVWDVGHNARAAAVIEGCEQMVLAERIGQSSWDRVADALELAKRLDKEACGFVLI